MTFLEPLRLWLLLLVAAVVALYGWRQYRRTAFAARFTNLALLDRVMPRQPGWRRHLPASLFALTLATLVVAFARPADEVKIPNERATVVLVMDVSVSMMATDVEPSRLAAAKEAATEFVRGMKREFNVGLVSFAGQANVLVSPTSDRDRVVRAVQGLRLAEATAVGEAIHTALQSIRTVDARAAEDLPPARIVLLTDGENTTGRPPREAAAEAADAEVPVTTIGFGTPNGVIEYEGERVPVTVDEQALREIAEITGGRFHTAESGAELRSAYQEIYRQIGSSLGFTTESREVVTRFVGMGLVFAFAAAASSLLWSSRLP